MRSASDLSPWRGLEVFNYATTLDPVFTTRVVPQRWVLVADRASVLSLLDRSRRIWLPGLSTVLDVVSLDTFGWMLVLSGSLVPLLVGQAALTLWHLSARRERKVQ